MLTQEPSVPQTAPTQCVDPVKLAVGDVVTQPVGAGGQQTVFGGQPANRGVPADVRGRSQHGAEHVRQLRQHVSRRLVGMCRPAVAGGET